MTDAPKTVFVTRNVLKEGIREAEVQKQDDNGYVFVKGDWHCIGRLDWHLTREAAITANALRDAKIRSLEAQVERLRGMVFE